MARERNHSIDVMKGIAILCVILGHIDSLSDIGKNLIFSFHMPLFFIVAGYFYKPVNNYREKLIKDVKRLIIPYIATGGVLCIYSFIVHFLLRSDHENAYLTFWALLFPTGLHGIVNANSWPIWFLFALFWCRQIYNLIFTKFNRIFAISIVVILSIGMTFLYEYSNLRFPLAIIQGMSAMFFYLIGMLISQYKKHIHWYHSLFCILIWLGCFRYCGVDMISCSYNNMPLAFVVAACGTLSIYYMSKLLTILSGKTLLGAIPCYLQWAGISSLVILCIHTVERYLPIWEIIGLHSVTLLFIGKVFLCSIVTYLCYKFRFTRVLFQLK